MLSDRIIRAAPEDLTAPELEALEEVRGSAEALQIAVGQRHDGGGAKNLRPLDRRFDGSWAALPGRLAAAARLVDEPEAPRAADLLASLFPDGLRFLLSNYEAQWFHSKVLLDRIMRPQGDPLRDHDERADQPGQTFPACPRSLARRARRAPVVARRLSPRARRGPA